MSRVAPEESAQVPRAAHDFVRKDVVTQEQIIVDTGAVPEDIRAKPKEMGLFGYTIPQEHGGLGLDLQQDVELTLELTYFGKQVHVRATEARGYSALLCGDDGLVMEGATTNVGGSSQLRV
jgi:alkylation response protein AidB-like acyl-CoA dehydrogenase